MIDYHAVSVIVDAWVNGIRGFNVKHALEACISSATNKTYGNLRSYMKLGYVPYDKNDVGSSMTLEYAYDDWNIAQLAKSIGNTAVANQFSKRAEGCKILFNDKTGCVGAKK
jgi:Putative alpha-1,2-mannosidase